MSQQLLARLLHKIKMGAVNSSKRFPFFAVCCIFFFGYLTCSIICNWRSDGDKSAADICAGRIVVAQDDPRLNSCVLKNSLFPPAKAGEAYNLSVINPKDLMGWKGIITERVRELFADKKDGFFVECGAFDGQFLSNTLALEQALGWSGLLIEGDPKAFELLKAKNRKAWTSNASLCLSQTPQKIPMYRHKSMVALSLTTFNSSNAKRNLTDFESFESQCYPLTTLLSAIGVGVVDYLSLDMEGVELSVLKTLDFDKIQIKTISVEVASKAPPELLAFMKDKGYFMDRYLVEPYTHDILFVKSYLK